MGTILAGLILHNFTDILSVLSGLSITKYKTRSKLQGQLCIPFPPLVGQEGREKEIGERANRNASVTCSV